VPSRVSLSLLTWRKPAVVREHLHARALDRASFPQLLKVEVLARIHTEVGLSLFSTRFALRLF
jgi:hypothetical protein